MIESKLAENTGIKSVLQENWPPKWFFSYSDLATLLMTFFIILATMLSLKIPLYALADKNIQKLIKDRASMLEEIRRLTEPERALVKEIEQLKPEQIETIVEMDMVKKLEDDIRSYIKEKDLEDFITVTVKDWKIRVIPLSPFLFDKGSVRIKQSARYLLDEIAGFIKKYPSRIKIEGHTDDAPIHSRYFSSNWELSVARANSVMRYFMENDGIPIENMEAVGFGEYHPLVPNDTIEHRMTNRRVVIEITPDIIKAMKAPARGAS